MVDLKAQSVTSASVLRLYVVFVVRFMVFLASCGLIVSAFSPSPTSCLRDKRVVLWSTLLQSSLAPSSHCWERSARMTTTTQLFSSIAPAPTRSAADTFASTDYITTAEPVHADGDKEGWSQPGIAENDKFSNCDESVEVWRKFGPQSNDASLQQAREILRQYLSPFDTITSPAKNASSITARAYWTAHVVRTLYFLGNAAAGTLASNWYERFVANRNNKSSPNPRSEMTSLSILTNGVAARLLLETLLVYQQEYQWIQRGVLKFPWDALMRTDDKNQKLTFQFNHRQANPLFALRETARTVREAVAIFNRRNQGASQDVWVSQPSTSASDRDAHLNNDSSVSYPEYYLNDFHYQTDGWFSSDSAERYEASTETLFLGRQDAMQRQTLVPVVRYYDSIGETGNPSSSSSSSPQSILEVAAGTGRFATFTRDLFPTADMTVTDLSPFYLEKARDHDKYWRSYRGQQAMREATGVASNPTPATFVQANAEALPFPDESFDVVTCVYLFHELPAEARQRAAAEMVRVVKPGGIIVLTDSYQLGDRPAFDTVMRRFSNLNEPYYHNYIETDLVGLFDGMECHEKYMASSSKTLSFVKPSKS